MKSFVLIFLVLLAFSSTGLTSSLSDCVKSCPVTFNIREVCGTDGVTYVNMSELRCIEKCGGNVHLKHEGPCKATGSGP